MAIINVSASNFLNFVQEVAAGTEFLPPCYVTLREAESYFLARLNTLPWDTADADTKMKALRQSTRVIDRLAFIGCKTDDEQILQFPRGGDTEVPAAIRQAVCENALALLDGVDPEMELQNLAVESQGYSSVRTTYDRTWAPDHVLAGIASPQAWHLLRPFLRDPNELQLSRV